MKEIIILGIIAVLVILIITVYEYYSVSNVANQTCTPGQICCPPPTSNQSFYMFTIEFCWVNGFTYPPFYDAGVSDSSGLDSLPPISMINSPNTGSIPSSQFITRWTLTTDTSIGSGILYQYNPSPTTSLKNYCQAILIISNGNIYTGIGVLYTFTDTTILSGDNPFSQLNVSNGANKKVIASNLGDTVIPANGAMISGTGDGHYNAQLYRGTCDLTNFINALSDSDKARVGTYNSSFDIKYFTSVDPALNLGDPTTTILNVTAQNGTTTVDATNQNGNGFRYGAAYGATVRSYLYNATSVGSGLYPVFHF
jgi:hypothetical protein